MNSHNQPLFPQSLMAPLHTQYEFQAVNQVSPNMGMSFYNIMTVGRIQIAEFEIKLR